MQLVAQIIRPPVADPGAFLLAHLLKDMEHLTKSLGKGTDDTIHTVHLLLCGLLEPQQVQQCKDVHYEEDIIFFTLFLFIFCIVMRTDMLQKNKRKAQK